MFEFYWPQKQQKVEVHYVENTQLHEDNQKKEQHPESFFPRAKDDVKKNHFGKESEHT